MKRVGSTFVSLLLVGLVSSACGGGAAAPPSPASPSAPPASPPASAAAKPAASAAPASASAAAKPSASGASGAAAGAITLKAGYPQATITQAPIFVAAEEGIYKNNGLDVTIQMIGGPQEVPAVMANEIQFAIDERVEQVSDVAAFHDQSSPPGHGDNRRWSCLRARDSRDMTVPSGTPVTAAISW